MSELTDSPLAFMKVCGLANMTGTSPMKPNNIKRDYLIGIIDINQCFSIITYIQ